MTLPPLLKEMNEMPKHTAHQEQKAVDLIVPMAKTAGTETGTGIDCKGFDEALIVLGVGTVPSNGTLNVHLEESDALATGYADITGAVFDEVTAANDLTPHVGRLNLRERKRYIRAVAVVGNQTIPLYVGAVLSEARDLPVSQVNDEEFSV